MFLQTTAGHFAASRYVAAVPSEPLISCLASSLSTGGRRISFPQGRARAETEVEEQILISYKYLLGSEAPGSRERAEYE